MVGETIVKSDSLSKVMLGFCHHKSSLLDDRGDCVGGDNAEVPHSDSQGMSPLLPLSLEQLPSLNSYIFMGFLDVHIPHGLHR